MRVWNADLEGLLLSTVPVTDAQSAARTARWYSFRWRVEDYHKGLKTGCRYEPRPAAHRASAAGPAGFPGAGRGPPAPGPRRGLSTPSHAGGRDRSRSSCPTRRPPLQPRSRRHDHPHVLALRCQGRRLSWTQGRRGSGLTDPLAGLVRSPAMVPRRPPYEGRGEMWVTLSPLGRGVFTQSRCSGAEATVSSRPAERRSISSGSMSSSRREPNDAQGRCCAPRRLSPPPKRCAFWMEH